MSDIGIIEDLGWIPLSDIAFNSYNPNQMPEAKYRGLYETIRDFGFREPVLVRPHPQPEMNIPWLMVDGEHRAKILSELSALPETERPKWMQAGMIDKIQAWQQDLTEAHAKLSTISMNNLHGAHDPIQEAKLLIEITREIGESDTMRYLGMRQIELDTSFELLTAAETPPLTTDGQEEAPVNVTIMLLPGQAMSYEQAMEKALTGVGDPDTLVLVQARAEAYDAAMQKAIKLGNIQKRGDAFWQICQWFLEADTAQVTERFPQKAKKGKK